MNYQFQVIKNNKKIIKHYIIHQFLLDFLQAIPFFSYLVFSCKNHYLCLEYNTNNYDIILLLCCSFKYLKIFKIFNSRKNYIYYQITIYASKNDYLEKIFNIFDSFFFYFFGFYFFISVHVFIGQHSYPNWIIKSNSQNKSLLLLYLTSFYYLLTTMTTVGYGDIVCNSSNELIFQIILLSVGIIVYSWIVSNIGNYIKNESYASMLYNKDEAILEEIRISYPKMPFKIYKKIFHHLNARKMRQKHCDSNILINSLPYSLKNKILLTMHKKIIENFKIFHGTHNTDFTLRLLMNLLPLFSKKNAILIREGQIIENIIFVKEGKLCLEALINIKNPYISVQEYLYKNFTDINEDILIVSNYDTSLHASKLNYNYQSIFKRAKNELDTILNDKIKSELNSSINESKLGKELGKWDFGGEFLEENEYQFINIINISKNESYGNVQMFLSKPSPLCLRVKSKNAELLLLRKYDAFDISKRYPNIWAKIFKKSFQNMLAIKKIAIHKIKHYWKNLGKKDIKMPKTLSKRKRKKNSSILVKKNKKEENIENEKVMFPKIKINNEEINFTTSTKAFNNNSNYSHIVSFSNKVLSNNYSTNATTVIPFQKSLNSDINTNKYISFGKGSSKVLSSNNNFTDKYSRFSTSKLLYRKNKSQRNINSFVHNKSIQNLRIEYINKLNDRIKKFKESKKYYKDLCKNLLIKLNNYENRDSCKNINNNERIDMTFESVDKKYSSFANSDFQSPLKVNKGKEKNLLDIQKLSISNSNSSSNYSGKSDSKSESILSKQKVLSIISSINLSFLAKYKNLDKLTLGEYSKNRNLRLSTEKYIKFYLSKNVELKEKIFDRFLTKKSINSIALDYSTSEFYTNEKKFKKLMTNESYDHSTPKRFISYSKEIKYLDENILFYYTGKNKIYNNKNNNDINKYSLKKYLFNKQASFDSIKKSSNLFAKQKSRSNLSSCSSYKKVKDKISKIKAKHEYEQEIELKNSERKSPKINSMKIKVNYKESK